MWLGERGVHHLPISAGASGQLDDIAVGVAEIDRADKAVIDRTAHLDALRPPFRQHRLEHVVLDAECDVQVEIVLPLEVERLARHLEESEAGAVIHREKGVQGFSFADLEGADQLQAEEILVEHPRLLGITATIGVVVQAFDHRMPRVLVVAMRFGRLYGVYFRLTPGKPSSRRKPGRTIQTARGSEKWIPAFGATTEKERERDRAGCAREPPRTRY